jgi:hypothetical protein
MNGYQAAEIQVFGFDEIEHKEAPKPQAAAFTLNSAD